jgi:hypothetical protein
MLLSRHHAGVLASVYEAELDDTHRLDFMGGIIACPGGNAVCESGNAYACQAGQYLI